MLELIRGDDYTGARSLAITVVDEAGAPVDLTGTTSRFMVKHRRYDLDDEAVISKANGAGITYAADQATTGKGRALIALSAADTAEEVAGWYELEATDSAGVITLAAGRFYINADLIRGG